MKKSKLELEIAHHYGVFVRKVFAGHLELDEFTAFNQYCVFKCNKCGHEFDRVPNIFLPKTRIFDDLISHNGVTDTLRDYIRKRGIKCPNCGINPITEFRETRHRRPRRVGIARKIFSYLRKLVPNRHLLYYNKTDRLVPKFTHHMIYVRRARPSVLIDTANNKDVIRKFHLYKKRKRRCEKYGYQYKLFVTSLIVGAPVVEVTAFLNDTAVSRELIEYMPNRDALL